MTDSTGAMDEMVVPTPRMSNHHDNSNFYFPPLSPSQRYHQRSQRVMSASPHRRYPSHHGDNGDYCIGRDDQLNEGGHYYTPPRNQNNRRNGHQQHPRRVLDTHEYPPSDDGHGHHNPSYEQHCQLEYDETCLVGSHPTEVHISYDDHYFSDVDTNNNIEEYSYEFEVLNQPKKGKPNGHRRLLSRASSKIRKQLSGGRHKKYLPVNKKCGGRSCEKGLETQLECQLPENASAEHGAKGLTEINDDVYDLIEEIPREPMREIPRDPSEEDDGGESMSYWVYSGDHGDDSAYCRHPQSQRLDNSYKHPRQGQSLRPLQQESWGYRVGDEEIHQAIRPTARQAYVNDNYQSQEIASNPTLETVDSTGYFTDEYDNSTLSTNFDHLKTSSHSKGSASGRELYDIGPAQSLGSNLSDDGGGDRKCDGVHEEQKTVEEQESENGRTLDTPSATPRHPQQEQQDDETMDVRHDVSNDQGARTISDEEGSVKGAEGVDKSERVDAHRIQSFATKVDVNVEIHEPEEGASSEGGEDSPSVSSPKTFAEKKSIIHNSLFAGRLQQQKSPPPRTVVCTTPVSSKEKEPVTSPVSTMSFEARKRCIQNSLNLDRFQQRKAAPAGVAKEPLKENPLDKEALHVALMAEMMSKFGNSGSPIPSKKTPVTHSLNNDSKVAVGQSNEIVSKQRGETDNKVSRIVDNIIAKQDKCLLDAEQTAVAKLNEYISQLSTDLDKYRNEVLQKDRDLYEERKRVHSLKAKNALASCQLPPNESEALKAYHEQCETYREQILDLERKMLSVERVLFDERKRVQKAEKEMTLCEDQYQAQARDAEEELTQYKSKLGKKEAEIISISNQLSMLKAKSLADEEAKKVAFEEFEVLGNDLRSRNDELNGKITSLEETNEVLRKRLEKMESDHSMNTETLQLQLDEKEAELDLTFDKLSTLESKWSQAEEARCDADEENKRLLAELTSAKAENKALQQKLDDNEDKSKLSPHVPNETECQLSSLQQSGQLAKLLKRVNELGTKSVELQEANEMLKQEISEKSASRMTRQLREVNGMLQREEVERSQLQSDIRLLEKEKGDNADTLSNVNALLAHERQNRVHLEQAILDKDKELLILRSKISECTAEKTQGVELHNKELAQEKQSSEKKVQEMGQTILDKNREIAKLRSDFSKYCAETKCDIERLNCANQQLKEDLERAAQLSKAWEGRFQKSKQHLNDAINSMRVEKTTLLSDVQSDLMNERVHMIHKVTTMVKDHLSRAEREKIEQLLPLQSEKNEALRQFGAEQEKARNLQASLKKANVDYQGLLEIINGSCMKLSIAGKELLVDTIDGILVDKRENETTISKLKSDLDAHLDALHITLSKHSDEMSSLREKLQSEREGRREVDKALAAVECDYSALKSHCEQEAKKKSDQLRKLTDCQQENIKLTQELEEMQCNARALEKERKGFVDRLGDMSAELAKVRESKSTEAMDFQQTISEKDRALSKVQSDVADLQDTIRQLEEYLQDGNHAKREKALQARENKVEWAEEVHQTFQEKDRELSELKTEYMEYIKTHGGLKATIQQLEDDLKGTISSRDSLKRQVNVMREQLSNALDFINAEKAILLSDVQSYIHIARDEVEEQVKAKLDCLRREHEANLKKIRGETKRVQKQMKDAFDADRNSVDKLVGDIILAKEEALLCQDELKGQVGALSADMVARDQRIEALQTVVVQSRQEVAAVTSKYKGYHGQLTALNNELVQEKNKSDDLMSHYRTIEDDLRQQLQSMQRERDELKRHLAAHLKESARTLDEFYSDRRELASTLQSKDDTIHELRLLLDELEKDKRHAKVNVDDLSHEISHMRKASEMLGNQLAELDEKNAQAQKELNHLTDTNATLSKANADLRNECDCLSSKEEKLMHTIQELESEVKRLSLVIDSERVKHGRDVQVERDSLVAVQASHDEKVTTIKELKDANEKMEQFHATTLNTLQNEVGSIKVERDCLDQQLAVLKDTTATTITTLQNDNEGKLKENELLTNRLNKALGEVRELTSALTLKEDSIRVLQLEIEELKSSEAEVSNRSDELVKHYMGIEDKLREQLQSVKHEKDLLMQKDGVHEAEKLASDFEELKSTIGSERVKHQDTVRSLQSDISNITMERDALGDRINSLASNLSVLQSALKEKNSLVDELKSELDEVKQVHSSTKADNDRLARELQEMKSKAKAMEGEHATLKSKADEALRMHSDVEGENDRLSRQLQNMNSSILALRTSGETKDTNIKDLTSTMEVLNKETSSLREDINKLVEVKSYQEEQINSLTHSHQSALDKALELATQVELCQGKLDEQTCTMANLERENATLRQAVESSQEKLNATSDALSNLRVGNSGLQSSLDNIVMEKSRSELRNKLEKQAITEELVAKEHQLHDTQTRLKKYEGKVKELARLLEENSVVIEALHQKLRGKSAQRA